jgi:hypothetical protein
MGYKSTIADPDVFMRKAAKSNGFEYYEYMLTYVDDCLCVSDRPEDIMDVIRKIYDLRTKSSTQCNILGQISGNGNYQMAEKSGQCLARTT